MHGLRWSKPQALFQLLWRHPKHSGYTHYTSHSVIHGIGDTSLNPHDHFWLRGAKRYPKGRRDINARNNIPLHIRNTCFKTKCIITVSSYGCGSHGIQWVRYIRPGDMSARRSV